MAQEHQSPLVNKGTGIKAFPVRRTLKQNMSRENIFLSQEPAKDSPAKRASFIAFNSIATTMDRVSPEQL